MSAGLDAELVRRVRRRLTDTTAEPTQVAVFDAVREEPAQAALGGTTLLRVGDRLYHELAGAGPLTGLLGDASVTDVVVNGPDEVWVDRGGGMCRTDVSFADVESLRRFAQRLAAACGRRLDDASPFVDARLADGTRLHAVLPPIAVRGPYLSLRTFRRRALTLPDLVRAQTLTVDSAQILDAVVAARLAYLVSGGTGSGKTTLLAALLGRVGADERIVIVEDATELTPDHPHIVALQSRPSNVEGAGAVGLRELVRQALRMRPDRLVVGECRGAEIVDVLGALNTGHDGGAATLHANAATDVPARLEALGLLGGIGREALHAQVVAGLQVVLHLRRRGGHRMLAEMCLLRSEPPLSLRTVRAWGYHGGTGPAGPLLARMLAERGVTPPAVLGGPA